MQLKRLRDTQDGLEWPQETQELPVISWQSCQFPCICPVIALFLIAHSLTVQEQSEKRPLVLISGFIHDVASFIDEHPGGRHLLVKNIGKDATTAFFGGVYDHSNAAHNVRLPFSACLSILAHACVLASFDDARWYPARRSTPRAGREIRSAVTTAAGRPSQRALESLQFHRVLGRRGHARLIGLFAYCSLVCCMIGLVRVFAYWLRLSVMMNATQRSR